MNILKRWFKELMVLRLITLIEFEENKNSKKLYDSSLERIIGN